MTGPIVGHGRPVRGRVGIWKVVLLAAFGAATFLAGRLWSLREAREAQRAAGQAERGRLALQAELLECRNALLLRGHDGEEATSRAKMTRPGAVPAASRDGDRPGRDDRDRGTQSDPTRSAQAPDGR